MGKTTPLFQSFSAGMKRDFPRDAMPDGSVWTMKDWIPDVLGYPLTKRGGWEYESNSITATKATASYVVGGFYAPFTAASKNCAIDEDGELYTIAANGTVTDVGAAVTPIAPLAFHRQLLIITASDGTTAPKSYDGTTLQNLSGSPPAGRYPEVYKDRALLASSTAQPQRLYFSGAGSPTTWDTTNGYIDASYSIVGLAALQNAILVFSRQAVERIRGSIPPPGSDMEREPLYGQGCIDARSIVIADDVCWWCDTSGVYQSDGASILDVTAVGGMKKYWLDLFASYASTWTVAAGRIRDYYVISVMDGSTFKDAFMVDMRTRDWMQVTNLKAVAFWASVGSADETYFGHRPTADGARVGNLTGIFSPASGVKNDGDGTAVTPVLETPYVHIGDSKARLRNLYLTYDLRDAASDNPTLTMSFITSPDQTSYTATTDLSGTAKTFAETTEMTYARGWCHSLTHGVAIKLTQANASEQTRLFGFATEAAAREATRVDG